MAAQADSPELSDSELLYLRVQSFYAWQMQLLDSGKVEDWADTFTEDGVFDAAGLPKPVSGRERIREGARRAAEDRVNSGVTHRHWLGMLTLERRADDAVFARSYALVIETLRGGIPTLHRSTVCEDVLVSNGSGWLIQKRLVSRDDLD
ncbi:nuclear transport factor 2 family protein [Sciscionella marina]|uniref:nuclear transport factor 2 family protein n=1 Tax=Sciscionella marina TaxID=508770 RepID=UPI00037942F3|nr:nuclear transport factor 2 family protein [Sciscionella marina]